MLAREPAFNPGAPLLGRVRLLDELGAVVHQWTSPQPNDLFGLSAIITPDVNADGIADVAIAIPNAFDDVAGTRVGLVVIKSGASGATLATISGTPLERFGLALFASPPEPPSLSPTLTVLVEPLDPQTNAPSGSFTFQSFDAFSGAFLTEAVQAPEGFTGEVLAASIAMYVRVVRPADLNASGSVTPLDLSVLASNYGTAVDPVTGQLLAQDPTLAAAPTGDTNGDGVVDASDLSNVLAGIGPPSDPNFVPIEEDLTEAEASVVAAAFDQLTGFTLTSANCAICATGVRKVRPVGPYGPIDPDNPPPPPGGGFDPCKDPNYTGDPANCADSDGDGTKDAHDNDDDNDGIPDESDPDDDGDGIPDAVDTWPGPGGAPPPPGGGCDDCPSVDLRADLNGDGVINDDDDEAENEGKALVLFGTSGDSDGDFWPDFADGFDYLPGFPTDDATSAQFTPVDLVIKNPDSDIIYIGYRDADPRQLDLATYTPWHTFARNMRLWLKPGDQTRDPRPFYEGGDYVPPGEYAFSELGIPSHSDSTTTFYVEVMSHSLDGLSMSMLSIGDSLYIQTVAFDVILDETVNQFRSFGLLGVEPTPRYSLDDVPDVEAIELIYQPLLYRVRIPIGSIAQISAIGLGGVLLNVEEDCCGGRISEPFWIDDPGDVINPNPGPTNAIAIPGTGVDSFPLQYFIATGTGVATPVDAGNVAPAVKKIKFPKDQDPNVVMFKLLDGVTDQLEADTANAWRQDPPYKPNDTGAFGTEVHKRISANLQGRPQWVTNVWVLKESPHTVMNIGSQTSPPGVVSDDVFEIDAVKLKKSTTPNQFPPPVVGATFPKNSVEQAFEIKTSANGEIDAKHTGYYNKVVGSGKWKGMNPKRRFTPQMTWVKHDKGIDARKIQKALAAAQGATLAGTAICLIIYDPNMEPHANRIRTAYANLLACDGEINCGTGAAMDFGFEFATYVQAVTGQSLDFQIVGACILSYVAQHGNPDD